MSSIRICAVILHYGDPALTARVHRQLLQSDSKNSAHIRVFDNAAPEPYPDAWFRAPTNTYWAGALQQCIDMVKAEGYSHLWFCNNDISFASPGPLLDRVRNRYLWISKNLGPVGVYSPSALRNPYHPQMIQDARLQIRTVPYVDGIAPLFTLEAVDCAGGIDLKGNPYGYGVDIVTSLNIHARGWLVVVDQQVALRHTYHSTARKVEGFMQIAAEAEAHYLARHLGPDCKHRIEELKTLGVDYESL